MVCFEARGGYRQIIKQNSVQHLAVQTNNISKNPVFSAKNPVFRAKNSKIISNKIGEKSSGMSSKFCDYPFSFNFKDKKGPILTQVKSTLDHIIINKDRE